MKREKRCVSEGEEWRKDEDKGGGDERKGEE